MNFKNKSLLVLLLSLIFILTLSVSFAQNNSSYNITNDDSDEFIESEMDEYSISSNEIYVSPNGTGSGLNADNPTNWDNAYISASSGSKIILLNGTYYAFSQRNLNKNLELIGSGNSTFDSLNENGFFTIARGITIKFDNLIFYNADTAKKGGSEFAGDGAIQNNGYLTITNCYLSSSSGWGTEGGAIHNSGTCNIYDSTFYKNTAKKGGSIYNDKNSLLNVYNCTFIAGSSKEGNCINLKESTAYVYNSTFINCSAKSGIISIKKSRILIDNCTFFNSKAVDYGAVINVEKDSNVEINDCTFNQCKSTAEVIWNTDGTKIGNGNGGAIYIKEEATLTISNSEFINCSAKGSGGAIYVDSRGNLILNNCSFINNTATRYANIYSLGYVSLTNSLIQLINTIQTQNINQGSSEIISISFNDGTNLYNSINVNVLLNNQSTGYVASSPSSSVTLNNLSSGIYTVTLSSTDNQNTNRYLYSQESSSFIVGEVENTLYLNIEDIEGYYGCNKSLNVSLKTSDGNVVSGVLLTINIGNTPYTLTTDDNGCVYISLNDLLVGNYTAYAVISGNDVIKANANVRILSTISSNDLIKKYGSNDYLKASFLDADGNKLTNSEVSFIVNSTVVNVTTDSNGIGEFRENLSQGTYNVIIVNLATKEYITQTLTVNSVNSTTTNAMIIANDMIRPYNSGVDFEATFSDVNGELLINQEVTFIVNGNEYNVFTDLNGIGTLNISLPVGTYYITAINPISDENITKKVVIFKRITENKNIIMDYSYSTSYKVRVYDDNANVVGSGEIVKFKLNGKTYNIKTDNKGYATLTVKNLLPKIYTITSEYKGSKVSNKITVKQILSSKNMKYKRYKLKVFTATLKTSKGKAIIGKKITFKFNGKKYTAKTNKKGVASIKIKKFWKVGKFKITVTYIKTSLKKTITVKR